MTIEFSNYKMIYLRSVLNGDKKTEKEALEKLIKAGQKLNMDTSKYQKELLKFTPTQKPKIDSVPLQKNSPPNEYNIKKVYTSRNSIIIEFGDMITDSDVTFFELHYKNLHKDVYDVTGRFKDAAPTVLSLNGVDKITIAQNKYNTLRIVLQNADDLKTSFRFDKNKMYIDIKGLKTSSKETPTVAKTKETKTKQSETKKFIAKAKNKVIVLDAGHGGKDVGAIGPGNKYEKNAVEQVTNEVYDILKARGYTVYRTRSNDTFVELKDRTKMANHKNADLFISIHANAAPKAKVNEAEGIETFFLSPARSDRAKRVAAKENSTDLESMNNSSQNTFLTLLNRSKITASQKLAIDVHQHILYSTSKMNKGIVDGGVREGPFWVLVGAQMPAILIEIGYISHPIESKRLFDKKYQEKLAYGVADGVNAYFVKNP